MTTASRRVRRLVPALALLGVGALALSACGGAGDPSPSQTVAELFGVTPTTVRQVSSRTLRKVRAVLGADRSPIVLSIAVSPDRGEQAA